MGPSQGFKGMPKNLENTLSMLTWCFKSFWIDSSKFHQIFNKSFKMMPPTQSRPSQGLWKMPKSLKNTLLLPRGCFSKYWTHHIWFCASLWSPFYISFNHNMWFFWTHHHLSCKGSCPRLFADCPCKFKGVFVALVVWFGSVFGRQPRGLIGLMACTPK